MTPPEKMQVLGDITKAMDHYKRLNGGYPDTIRVPQALISEELERWCLRSRIHLEAVVPAPSAFTVP